MYDIFFAIDSVANEDTMSRRELNPLTWSVKHVRVCKSSIRIRRYTCIEAMERSIFRR